VYGHHFFPLFSGKENPWRESAFSCCDCQGKQLDFAILFWWQFDGIGVPFWLQPLGNPAFAPGFLFACIRSPRFDDLPP
jgi:hypothetical protein